jgi:hypothetical protein
VIGGTKRVSVSASIGWLQIGDCFEEGTRRTIVTYFVV